MKEQVLTFLRRSWVLPTGIGVASFGGGLAVGYLVARRKFDQVIIKPQPVQLQLNFDEKQPEPKRTPEEVYKGVVDTAHEVHERVVAIEKEVLDRHPYAKKWFEGDLEVTDQVEVKVAVDIPDDEPQEDGNVEEDAESYEGGESNVVNIFANAESEWDYEKEVAQRSPDHPYIIHSDEFYSDEMGWDNQLTLTWYEGDQILCDDKDVPIYNPDQIVGHLNFGHGSGDPNVVYVRNEKLQCEYEVLRDPGSYEIDVLGGHVERAMQEQDLRHSRHPGKFREA